MTSANSLMNSIDKLMIADRLNNYCLSYVLGLQLEYFLFLKICSSEPNKDYKRGLGQVHR